MLARDWGIDLCAVRSPVDGIVPHDHQRLSARRIQDIGCVLRRHGHDHLHGGRRRRQHALRATGDGLHRRT